MKNEKREYYMRAKRKAYQAAKTSGLTTGATSVVTAQPQSEETKNQAAITTVQNEGQAPMVSIGVSTTPVEIEASAT